MSEPLGFSIVQVAVLLALLSALIGKKNKIPVLHIGLCGLVLIAVAVSAVINGWSGGALVYGEEFLVNAFIPFFFFSIVLDRPGRVRGIMALFVLFALVMVSNGISQQASVNGVGWAGTTLMQGTRITYLGFLNDPNDLGMFFVVSLAFSALLKTSSSTFLKILGIVGVPVIVYGIYMTNSRGALLATFTMIGFYIYLKHGVVRLLTLLALASPVLIFVLLGFREISAEEESAHGRIDAWYAGMRMFLESPLFGVGMHGFADRHLLTAHNSYVLVIAELGLFGYLPWFILVFLSVFGSFRYSGFSAFNGGQTEEETNIAKGTLFAMIGMLVAAFFLSRSYNTLLFSVLGVSVAIQQQIRRRTQIRMIQGGHINVAAIFAIGSIIFMYIVQRVLN